MAESATRTTTVQAPARSIMDVIADIESYPEWTGQVGSAQILDRHPSSGRPATVRFALRSGIISDEYTVAYTWDADRSVRWTLIEGKVLKEMDGSYVLRPLSAGATEVTYELSVDLSIPMIGAMKRRAAKMVIDIALNGLRGRVEDD